jgi:prolyl oligopeptidase
MGPKELPLPMGSIVQSMSGRREDSELFYSFSSFISPGIIYRYDFKTLSHSVYKETQVEGLKKDFFDVYQVFYESKDGTKVPMFIISKKGLVKDGSHPTLLYGYGGFNISVTPRFSVTWNVSYFGMRKR